MAFDPSAGDAGPQQPGDNSAFLKQLAAALAAVGGGIGGRAIANSQGNPLQQAIPPELSSLLQMSNQRYAYQNPLFQATTQGTYDMLPDFAKTGTSLSGTLSNAVPSPSASGGASGPGLGTAAGLGGAAGLLALLAKLGGGGAGGGGDLAKAFDAIKKKFGGGQPTPGTQTGTGFVNGSGGAFDASGDWVPDTSLPDLTPETSGRAYGPDGTPLPVDGADRGPVDWSWLFGGGGNPFGAGSNTGSGSGDKAPWEAP